MQKQGRNETKKANVTMDCKYLDPKADLTFKLVFGEHPDLVMSLLNALLPLEPDGQITTVEYWPTEMVPENPGKKDSVVDVRCTDQKGRQFIVEMQLYWNQYFKNRVLLNASKAVVKQLKEGEGYNLIQPVYCLNLINDIGFDSEPGEFYHDYAIVNVAHSDRIIEGLRFVFVELPKFVSKRVQNGARISSVEREQTRPEVKFRPENIAQKRMAVLWLRFLTEINKKTQEAPAELLENEKTRKALSLVERAAMSDEQLDAYDKFWMSVTDQEGFLEARYNKGKAEGEAIGLAKGEAIGIAKGEANERMRNARSLKENGIPIDVIAKSLALTDAELQQL
jgi:predicted transposase/invertase (TIGR01784 family)